MERHANDVDTEMTIVIKVSRNYAADTGKQGHRSRRHLQLREKLGQPKSYRPVKVEVERSLYLTRLISAFDARMRRLFRLGHQICWHAQALCFCSNAGTSVSARILSASS